jgi:small subunit ribosomal protein S16
MTVRIRLKKQGKKFNPSYKIIAIDKRAKRDGKALEILGHYNPSHTPVLFELNEERFNYWTNSGAQPSKTVKELVAGEYKFKPYKPSAEESQEEA